MSQVFVSTQWLAENLSAPGTIAVDASWYLPTARRDPLAEFLAGHIPGAVFFDIDAIADRSTDLPHMLPSPDFFAEAVGKLGISHTSTIVVYDESGLFSAPRVWWSFRAMGAQHVYILEGGGARWRAEGRPIEVGQSTRAPSSFEPRFEPGVFTSFEDVRARLGDGETQIIDARPADRFAGRAPEPRPSPRAGHIPGSINLPVGQLTENGELKSVLELRRIFDAAGIDVHNPIIATCGSGITASALALALRTAGAESVAIYDGSWAEWGSRPDAEIA